MLFALDSRYQLAFSIHLSDKLYRKVFLNLASNASEAFYGFGEQFSFINLKGHRVPVMVREDGVGRGLQPITAATNFVFGPYAGGDETSAYKPVPFFFTNRLRALILENHDYALFDLTDADAVTIKVESTNVAGRIIFGDTPKDIVEQVTLVTGRMAPVPDWVLEGVIAGIQGGEQTVMRIINAAFDHGVPLAAVWLQDWCGKREQVLLGRVIKRLWWNWESDDVLYPNWNEFVALLAAKNVNVLCYVNSFLADVGLSKKPSFRKNLFQEASSLGYLVRDSKGDLPLSISSGPNFRAGLVDLHNKEAFLWMKQVLVDVFSTGVKGYMADFAEFLPPDAVTSKGVASSADHNEYAELWSRVQQEVLKDVGAEDKLVFHRSGFTRSPGITNSFWTGDQLVSWDSCDGIKAGLTGLLTSGLSGFSINHTDVGGYSTFAFDLFGLKIGYYRSQELLLRWMELCIFQPIFRSHEGNMPDVNAQIYDNSTTFEHLALCGRLFKSLGAYKKTLMQEAKQKGYPLMRHMLLEFPNDPICWNLKEQFMLGSAMLVAPVLDFGARTVNVYLPAGQWKFVWDSSKKYGDAHQGAYVTVKAPLGRPPVFLKEESFSDETLQPFIRFVDTKQ